MRAGLAYLLLLATRTRSPLAPAAAVLFALVGTFAGPRNEVGSTWALTSLLAGGLSAWLVFAILSGEPEAQAEMATTAAGGRSARRRLEALLIGCVAWLLTVVFISYPLVLHAVFGWAMFDRPAAGWDVIGAAIAHLACCALGGSVGALFAPPRVKRRATAVAGIAATLLLLAGAAPPKNFSAGPIALARALEKTHGQAVSGAALLSGATCLLLAAAMLLAAKAWTQRVT